MTIANTTTLGFRRIQARRPLLCASYSTRGVERTPSLPPCYGRYLPKPIVFFDSRKEAYDAMHACRNWLEESDGHQYSKKQARETVKAFVTQPSSTKKQLLQRSNDWLRIRRSALYSPQKRLDWASIYRTSGALYCIVCRKGESLLLCGSRGKSQQRRTRW